MKHKYAFWFALPLCMGLAGSSGTVWYGAIEPGQRIAGLGPYLRLLLSGFDNCRI